MMIQSLRGTLQQHPFFAGLSPDFLELVAGCSTNARYRNGELLMQEGTPADQLFLIRSGRVRMQIRAAGRIPLVVATMTDGDLLGWSWLVPPYLHRATAEAIGEVRVFAIDGRCLRNKCEANPALGYDVLKRICTVLADRLAGTRVQLLDLYGGRSD